MEIRYMTDREYITINDAYENNLQHVSLRIPKYKITVFTGVSVLRSGRELLEYEMSRVHFRTLESEEIRRYIATGEPMDKAGAYGAQGKAALFVQGIDGDFFNVMGLPLCRLGQMLKEQGVVLL